MSTLCSQSFRPHRLVVSEYEVPKVFVSQRFLKYLGAPPPFRHGPVNDIIVRFSLYILKESWQEKFRVGQSPEETSKIL